MNVDTSWYCGTQLGNRILGHLRQAVTIVDRPGIPVKAQNFTHQPDAGARQHGAFHFAMIEQGGSSLYTRSA